ncbi:MAG TPA: BtpA/SgcQ family protein, partial [Acetobacteraceae bacterium]|nr:BtpA/SgcQ family protein [Acetobacteraceae bacterium]
MAMSVAAPRGNAIQEIFGRTKVVIGVVHCPPLPGAPDHDGTPVTTLLGRALDDARAYVEAGCDGLIVENHGDIPFLKPDA